MYQDQNNSLNETLNECIEDIKKLQESAKINAENSEDVKDGKCDKEDELQEPGYILYQQIAESTISILQNEEIVKSFKNISDNIGEELSKNLVTVIAVSMTQASHQAILFYDDLLKREIEKQFDILVNNLNIVHADTEGCKSAITLLRNKIGDIENIIKIKNFNKENNIN